MARSATRAQPHAESAAVGSQARPWPAQLRPAGFETGATHYINFGRKQYVRLLVCFAKATAWFCFWPGIRPASQVLPSEALKQKRPYFQVCACRMKSMWAQACRLPCPKSERCEKFALAPAHLSGDKIAGHFQTFHRMLHRTGGTPAGGRRWWASARAWPPPRPPARC